jgi:phosphoserine phosphatase
MFYVATLISHPERPAVTHELTREVADFLPFGRIGVRLDPGVAVDIDFRFEDLDDPNVASEGEQEFLTHLANEVRDIIGTRPVDAVVQPDNDHRRKRLFVADMDSTMIGQECIDELADFVGLKAHVAAITERAMRGEIAFEPALRERVALLKGLPASVIDEVIRDRVTLTPGARTLVATMRANGAHACLVSGGFTSFTQRIAKMIGFDEDRGNVLGIGQDGALDGTVAEPILGREAKLGTLIALRDRLGLAPPDTLAAGDGANDLAMIGAAGLGVAYHAKPAVAAAAHARIDHGDLTALLYLQGYRRADFKG